MKNKVLNNASWIVCCKIMQSLLSFVIGMITARYLGPSNYGLISYAASITAFFLPIMQLGLKNTIVQEFISTPQREGRIIGTSLVLNGLSAVLCVLCITVFSLVSNPGEPETTLVCFLYSLTLVFQAGEITQYWFQSKLLSKYPSLAALAAYVLVSAYKVYILFSGKPIAWFALTHVLEAMVVSLILYLIYRRMGQQRLGFSFRLARELFSRSRYYISSGLMVVIFQQTDRIMLKLMLGQAETGFYSAAITCIGITGFVFSAVIDTARPLILEARKESGQLFEKRLITLFSLVTAMSVLQSLSMTVLAHPIISILYGREYLPAVPVLQIAVWYVTFGYYGVVRNIWILGEGKQSYLWIINLSGAVVNVAVNYLLIPRFGACGAAAASLLTQLFTNFVLCFIMKPIRPAGNLILKGLNPRYLIETLRHR